MNSDRERGSWSERQRLKGGNVKKEQGERRNQLMCFTDKNNGDRHASAARISLKYTGRWVLREQRSVDIRV